MTQLSARRRAATSAVRPAQGWTPPPLEAAPRGRRLLAALSLTALIAGVPVALSAVIGWPLPGSLPNLAELHTVLSSPLAPSLVIDVLALVAWAAWAHFAVCVLVELTAAARARSSGRVGQAVHVPGGRWSQELARRLVETAFASAIVTSVGLATFSGTILTPARPAVAAVQALPAESAAHHAALLHVVQPATGPATAQVGKHQAAAPRPEYVVQAPHGGYYDSLWDIADRFLGDGQRWREIYELNESLEQPDGRKLSRPDLIRPGWRLQLPYDAAGLGSVMSPDAAQPAPSAADNDTGVSADAPPAPAQPHCAPIPLQAPAPPTPSPASALGADRSEAEAQLPFTSADPTPAATAGEDDQVSTGDEDEEAHSPGAVVPFSGLLAAAALAALATRRRRQRRRRAAGQSIAAPGQEAARVEVDLRVLAEPEDLTLVDEALRALSVSLRDGDRHRPPDVRSASLRGGNLELGLGDPDPDAPPPFLADADGLVWRAVAHARPLVSPEQASQALPLFPLLLTVGRDAEGLVLLDLEAAGSLAVEGPAADVRDVLCHVVAEAALAPWAEDVEIVLLGFEKDSADKLESLAADRITSVDEVDAALLRVLVKRAAGAAAAGNRLATRLRRGVHDEVRPPLLLVCAAPPSPASSEQLASLLPAAGRGAVTVVTPGPWSAAHATWTIGRAIPVPGAGPAPAPCRLDAERLNHLAELLRVAREVPDLPDQQVGAEAVSVIVEGARLRPALPHEARLTGAASVAVPAPRVVEREEQPEPRHPDELDVALDAYFANTAPASVAFLGPITVHATGSLDPDRLSRLTEIVAYLATHRRGVPVADFDTAIWPERQVTLKTRNQAITRARAWLGSDEDGVSWLRPMCDGALRLSTQVLVDWELFQALQRRAREPGRCTDVVRRDLETAMRLVRGRPLSPLPTGRYGWLAETYLEQEMPSAIIDVAHALAGLLLQAGDAAGAMEVARLALEVDRYDERPWRDLLEAHHLRGEGRQVALLVDQLLELLEVEVDDELQPETAELIERLLPRRRRA
jgi:MYXO-CTERM domain-containing protein